MKRTFAKRGFMSLVAGFFLIGMLLLSAQATAQSTNWVNSDEAKVRLEQAVKDQHQILASQPTNNDAMLHATYYKAIYRLIADGSSVEVAVTEAMGSVLTSVDPAVPASSTMSGAGQGLLDDATALLTD